jgi:hypothetical protein
MDPLYLVRLAGIEPTTPWFVAKYSIQLSYSRERRKLYSVFKILQTLFHKYFSSTRFIAQERLSLRSFHAHRECLHASSQRP